MPRGNRYPERQIASFAVVGVMGVAMLFIPSCQPIQPSGMEIHTVVEVAAPGGAQGTPPAP